MAYDVKKLLDIAMNEVGYLEKETYDQLDEKTANAGDENYTKYQRDLAKLSYFNSSKKGVAWCAVFVAWCFVQAFGKTAALKLLCQPSSGNCGAGCNSQMNYYKDKKQFYTNAPQIGDQILFWSSDKTEASHTGIVYKVDKTYVYTIEGNTSSSSGVVANGGAVAKKKYKLTYDRIAGYGRPNYGVVTNQKEEAQETPMVELTPAWVHGTTSGAVNYRKAPSKSASRVSGMQQIKEGEQVGVKTSDGTWAAVEYNGYQGYVMLEFLTYDKPVEKVETAGAAIGVAWVNSDDGIGTGYRQSPSSSAPYVSGSTYIPHGEQVFIKTTDGTWAAVEYNNYRGYVLMKDLTCDKQEIADDDEENASDTVAWIYGATGKGASYKRSPSILSLSVSGMSHIPNGEQVYITNEATTWAAVNYKEYSGYVKMQYLTKTQVVDSEHSTTELEQEVPKQGTYTTVQGDTLWGISQKFYGEGYKYKKIMAANGMKNTIVRPGMVLKIPEK